MYGNGSGFGIASLDPNACTEPVMKCPCETCRVMRDELLKTYNDQVEKRLIAVEGVNFKDAHAHIKVIPGSFEPKHEHKIAGCAYLASMWFVEGTVK